MAATGRNDANRKGNIFILEILLSAICAHLRVLSPAQLLNVHPSSRYGTTAEKFY